MTSDDGDSKAVFRVHPIPSSHPSSVPFFSDVALQVYRDKDGVPQVVISAGIVEPDDFRLLEKLLLVIA